MSSHPSINLSCLRDIGWREWDPIGLLAEGGRWDQQPFADEYDSYLLHVAGDLRRGAAPEDAANYLVGIEREHMGLGVTSTQKKRAQATVQAIGKYMVELDGCELPAAQLGADQTRS